MKNLIKIFIISILVVGISFASADIEEDFKKAEEIIKQKIPCGQLSDEELKNIGDYYIGQMHPGELHEIMDERMGGEGSENLRLVHINIARAFYCGESQMMSAGMMNVMMGRSYGMMNYYPTQQNYENRAYPQYFFIAISLTIVILIILLVILITKTRRRR